MMRGRSTNITIAGTWYFLPHSWMADGRAYSWPCIEMNICLRKPVFQKPEIIERRWSMKTLSGSGTVPGWPIWWKGCDPYHMGMATVQPVFCATISAIRVTMKVSSPYGPAAPWFSVEPIGMMITSFFLSRSSTSNFVIVWK